MPTKSQLSFNVIKIYHNVPIYIILFNIFCVLVISEAIKRYLKHNVREYL